MFRQRLRELTNGSDSVVLGLGIGLALVACTVTFVVVAPALWAVTQLIKS